jgi:PAS domain S-box-containing protein
LLLVALLVVLADAVVAYRAWGAFNRRSEQEAKNREVVDSADALLSSLKDAEAGQRGFLLTGREHSLDRYREAVKEVPIALRDLGGISGADGADQVRRIDAIRPLVMAKLDEMAQTIELRQNGKPDAALAIVLTDRGKVLMDQIRSLATKIVADSDSELRQETEAADLSARVLEILTTFGSGVLFLLLVVAAITVRRGTVQREELLQDVARNHELLNTFVRSIPVAAAMLDREMRYVEVSDTWCVEYGLERSRILGRSHYEVFPEIAESWKERHRRCLNGETLRSDEDFLERADGRSAWLRWELRPWGKRNGLPEGILIFSEDITERKEAEEVLRLHRELRDKQKDQALWQSEEERRKLGDALRTAEEDAARRLASELHDDIVQRLAFLSMELGRTAAEPPGSTELVGMLRSCQARISEIADGIRNISHQLHPSIIEDLGLSAALKSLCREFEQAEGISVQFEARQVPEDIGSAVASCLYRVAQESLRNIAKHAKAEDVTVLLSLDGDSLELAISDTGVGFEPSTQKTGLGSYSMNERVRFVNGTIAIDSVPGCGTSVVVRVPLNGETRTASAYSAG